MRALNYFFDWGLYEDDIIAAGGSVEYTGDIIYRGYGYVVERAFLSLAGHSLCGYMKRFKLGNAVLCSYGEDDSEIPVHKKIVKCDIALALNDMDRRSADFFECRLLRDFLLWVIGIVEVVLLLLMAVCLYKTCTGLYIAALFLVACLVCLSLMFYLRMVCKSKTPLNYKAKLWTDERLRRYCVSSDEDL